MGINAYRDEEKPDPHWQSMPRKASCQWCRGEISETKPVSFDIVIMHLNCWDKMLEIMGGC